MTALLDAANECEPGEVFDHAATRYRRIMWKSTDKTPRSPAKLSVGVENLTSGELINLTRREDEAFWAWVIIEVLRHSGVRLEELLEITHLALVSYTLPDTGEIVPLLHIVPSKSNEERLLPDQSRTGQCSGHRDHPITQRQRRQRPTRRPL